MMRKYRGIVCEKQETHFVFLTTEGEFLRGTPVEGNPSIGDEVEFYLLQAQTKPRKKWKPLFLAPALVAAVLLVVFVASLIPESEKAFAYVQLEGVDSIELGVDEEGNVITLRSLDEAPTEIGDDWIGLPIAVVLTKAVQEISPKEEVVITTIYDKEEKGELKQTIEKAVSEVQQKNTEKPVQLEKSTKEERSKANEKQKSIQQFKKQKATEQNKKKDAPPVDKAKQEKNPAAEKKQDNTGKQNNEKKNEKMNHKQENRQEKNHKNKRENRQDKKHDKKQEKDSPKNNKHGKDKEQGKKDHPSKGNGNGNPHHKDGR